MPPLEQSLGMSQQEPTDFGGFAAPIDHRLKITIQMSPTKLTSLDPGITLEPIADDHLLSLGPQDVLGDIGPSGRGDREDSHPAGHRRPEPHLIPALPPRSLVDVSHGGVTDVLPKFFDGSCQLVGGLPLQPTDHADRDRQAEQVEGELADGAFAQAIGPDQDAEDGPKSWAEGP